MPLYSATSYKNLTIFTFMYNGGSEKIINFNTPQGYELLHGIVTKWCNVLGNDVNYDVSEYTLEKEYNVFKVLYRNPNASLGCRVTLFTYKK